MAHSLSAKKRIRQNVKNRARNRWRLRIMRTAIKDFVDKLAHGTEQEATEAFRKVAQIVDRTAARGVIHKNQAARRKSRMVKRLKTKFAPGAEKTTAKTGKSAAPKAKAAKSSKPASKSKK